MGAFCAQCVRLFFASKHRTPLITPKKQALNTQHQACSVTGETGPVANLKLDPMAATITLISENCYERPKGPDPLSRDDWDALLVNGAKDGSTNEEGGNSLNQPITRLDKSRSSKSI